MNYSTRPTLPLKSPPSNPLFCSLLFWFRTLGELRRRCGGRRESGAFLLGSTQSNMQRIKLAVYYDDLDPHVLDTGIIRFDGHCYGALWRLCERHSIEVLADVHCHPGGAGQSLSDQAHPMVPQSGHTAIIIPNFARDRWGLATVGVYRYQGGGRWATQRSPRFIKPWLIEIGAQP